MSRMIIMPPLPITAVTATRGSGAANLLTDNPREAWVDSATGSASVRLDLGAAASFDTLFIGYTNGTADTSLTPSYGLAGYTETALAARPLFAGGTAPTGRRHCVVRLAASASARYVQLAFNQLAAPALQVGIVAVGLAFAPTWNHELGSGRWVGDTGTRERLAGGCFAVDEGAATTGWTWTLGDLSVDEADTLYELARDRRQTRSVLVCEDPDATSGQSQRAHWGMFDRLEPWERRDPAKTRWSFRIEDWA